MLSLKRKLHLELDSSSESENETEDSTHFSTRQSTVDKRSRSGVNVVATETKHVNFKEQVRYVYS